MYFDSHAHYDDERFEEDRESLLESLKESGVDFVVNAAADMSSCHTSLALAEKYSFIYSSIGVHPHDVKDLTEADLEEMKQLAFDSNNLQSLCSDCHKAKHEKKINYFLFDDDDDEQCTDNNKQ